MTEDIATMGQLTRLNRKLVDRVMFLESENRKMADLLTRLDRELSLINPASDEQSHDNRAAAERARDENESRRSKSLAEYYNNARKRGF